MSAEAWGLHPRVHADTEEAELGTAQGSACAVDQWDRSDDVHPRCRPQPAGALDRADPRGPCERSAGRALSRDSRNVGRRGRCRPPAGTLEVRSEAGEEGIRSFEFQVSSFEQVVLKLETRKLKLAMR